MKFDLTSLLGMTLDIVKDSLLVRSLKEKPTSRLSGDTFYMEMPQSGISFVGTTDGRVSAVQLYNKGYDKKYRQFKGELPEALNFTETRDAVRKSLGKPSAFTNGGQKSILGIALPADRYDRKTYSLHLEYTKDKKSIGLVSLMRPDIIKR